VDDERVQAPWREENARIEAIRGLALDMREAACRMQAEAQAMRLRIEARAAAARRRCP
jgi:hypothetical protein